MAWHPAVTCPRARSLSDPSSSSTEPTGRLDHWETTNVSLQDPATDLTRWQSNCDSPLCSSGRQSIGRDYTHMQRLCSSTPTLNCNSAPNHLSAEIQSYTGDCFLHEVPTAHQWKPVLDAMHACTVDPYSARAAREVSNASCRADRFDSKSSTWSGLKRSGSWGPSRTVFCWNFHAWAGARLNMLAWLNLS